MTAATAKSPLNGLPSAIIKAIAKLNNETPIAGMPGDGDGWASAWVSEWVSV